MHDNERVAPKGLLMQRHLFCIALTATLACGDLPPPELGQLNLGLSSGFGEERYRLARASFNIQGTAADITLDSEDDPADDTLQRSLPEGDYSVQLLNGWQLER